MRSVLKNSLQQLHEAVCFTIVSILLIAIVFGFSFSNPVLAATADVDNQSEIIPDEKQAKSEGVWLMNAGDSTVFPTWSAPRVTYICGKTNANTAHVRVNVGLYGDEFDAVSDKDTCVSGAWGGVRAGVTNGSSEAVYVWSY